MILMRMKSYACDTFDGGENYYHDYGVDVDVDEVDSVDKCW